ncbi:MAG: DNA polymerase III subunit alpha, partial [Enterococcus sp.]|nr:DNA polymerase III subunit alpha [Enterococcus sp.]
IAPLAYHEIRALKKEDSFAVQVANHIKEGTKIQDLRSEIYEFQPKNYFVSKDSFEKWYEEANETLALNNAVKLASNCNIQLQLNQKLLPQFPLPKNTNPPLYLKQLCYGELAKRVVKPGAEYYERLDYELAVIHKMGFDDYFLIVWDLMRFAHEQGIVTGAGRGSAAGSLVAYTLSITEVDPIEHQLLFERFLNPERQTMPDIDLDFPDYRREEMLQYVKDKYGQEHVAQIATFGTMAAKMVLRDVSRVFGLSQSEANRWSAAIPKELGVTLDQAYQKSKNLQALVNTNERFQKIFRVAQTLEGLPRHVSTHAAGVVISDQNLLDLIPLQAGAGALWLTQYTMNDVEKIGLLKMDFLGLKNLSIIDYALKSIKKLQKETFRLNQISLNDPKTLQLFQTGETTGIFQFESPGIRKVLKKLQPENIEDIVAVNALYRPGPMENIDSFVKRKKGLEPITYPDHRLISILKNTYGIIVYQEQIMQVAAVMAGYRLGQADILRRAISKKKASLIDEERIHFVEGAKKQGFTREKAEEVYQYIEKFANYGFNRSHAFAYSVIAFQMAYLKTHFPGPFYAALLQVTQNQPEKIKEYIFEAKKAQIQILPPSINASSYGYRLMNLTQLRFGLGSIKGLRRDFIQEIIRERNASGPYLSFEQFLYRLNANHAKWLKEELIQPLILVGAFDELTSNRNQLLTQLSDKIQNILYSGGSMELLSMLELKERAVAEFSLAERLAYEETYLGFYLSGHPNNQYKKIYQKKQIVPLNELYEEQKVNILLYAREIRELRTKRGERMAIIEGNDESDSIRVTVFPELYREIRKKLEESQVYLIEGKVQRSDYNGQLQVIAYQIHLATEIEAQLAKKRYYIKITEEKNNETNIAAFQKIRKKYPGEASVLLFYAETGKKVLIDSPKGLAENQETVAELLAIFGEGNIVLQ